MKSSIPNLKDHLYLRIAKSIEQQINACVLKIGDKLPLSVWYAASMA